jgi:hypothetical protein
MLLVFYMDVTKVDLNVAYVVSVLSGYCSGYTNVAGVCSKYFICLRRMLQEVLSYCKCFMSRRRRSPCPLYECCKSRYGCRIYCNSYTHILEVSIQNVSSTSDVYCKCFYLDVVYVANVCSKCSICFKRILQKVLSCCKCIMRRPRVYMCFISIKGL